MAKICEFPSRQDVFEQFVLDADLAPGVGVNPVSNAAAADSSLRPMLQGDHVERRRSPRVKEEFPVTVSGVDATGRRFRAEAIVDNLGAGGMYLRLSEHVMPGAKISAVVRMAQAGEPSEEAPRVATRGVVIRVEQRSDKKLGVAVAFERYRFV